MSGTASFFRGNNMDIGNALAGWNDKMNSTFGHPSRGGPEKMGRRSNLVS